MSGHSSGDSRVKNSQCNYVTFPSLPLKDGETFTPDDWFVAEAATEGGGLPWKQTLHLKPIFLTASRPPSTMQRTSWGAGHSWNKHGNKYGTDSPRWLSLIQARWALITKHTNREDSTHDTEPKVFAFHLILQQIDTDWYAVQHVSFFKTSSFIILTNRREIGTRRTDWKLVISHERVDLSMCTTEQYKSVRMIQQNETS